MDYFNLALLPALIIFIAVFVVSSKNLKWGFWSVLITTPLVHKELFSLGGIWDLLPIRVALLGLFLASGVHFLKWVKSNTLESTKKEVWKYVNSDPFIILLLLLWIIRAISLFTAKLPQPGILLFAFYTSVTGLYFVFLE